MTAYVYSPPIPLPSTAAKPTRREIAVLAMREIMRSYPAQSKSLTAIEAVQQADALIAELAK